MALPVSVRLEGACLSPAQKQPRRNRTVKLQPEQGGALCAQIDAGLEAIDQAMASGFEQFSQVRSDPNLEPLRKSPAFQGIINKVRAPCRAGWWVVRLHKQGCLELAASVQRPQTDACVWCCCSTTSPSSTTRP